MNPEGRELEDLRSPTHWSTTESEVLEGVTSDELRRWFGHVLDVLDCVLDASDRFFRDEGLRCLPVPGTTSSVSSPSAPGSDSEPVRIQVGRHEMYLVDSAQFLLEYGCRLASGGCYCITPCYRSEIPDSRHLSTFVHAEAESQGSLEDVMALASRYVRAVAAAVLSERPDVVRDIAHDLSHIERGAVKDEHLEISFDEAVDMLKDHPRYVATLENGARNLTPEAEREILRRTQAEFVWVKHWDYLSVPFYQACDREETYALNADLLFGLGEVIGAGERHVTAESLERGMELHSIPTGSYAWYRDMKKALPLRTSGFGVGIERLMAWLLGLDDIRPLQIFPRDRFQHGVP